MPNFDVKEIFNTGQEANIRAYLKLLDHIEVVDLFYVLDDELYPKIIHNIKDEVLVKALPFLEKTIFSKVAQLIPQERMITIFDELETDDAAYLIRLLSKTRGQELLPHLRKKDAIEQILSYPEDSAGSLMQTEVCVLRTGMSVYDAIRSIRAQKNLLGEVHNAYLLGPERVLKGIIRLDDLILANFESTIDDISTDLKVTVLPEVDQEDVAHIFMKHDLRYLPVVNPNGVLLGQIMFDDIHDVIEDEAEEDILAMAGLPSEASVVDVDRHKGVVALTRFPWMVFSICASLVTGKILSFFDGRVENAIIFASFVPLIMNTTGNVGTQTAMIITRNFAIGKNEFGQFNLPIAREVTVGFLMGILAGSLTFLAILLFYGDIVMASKIAMTLLTSITAASLFGMIIPIGFQKIGVDPAIAAGPFVTSSCDMISVSIYLMVIISMKNFW